MLSPGWSSLIMMWSVCRHEDSSRPAKPDENAMPGLAPAVPPGLDPVELVVDAERFVVTRRADSPGTYHFDWISQPASYRSPSAQTSNGVPDRAERRSRSVTFWPRSIPRPATWPTNPQADRLAGRRLASPSTCGTPYSRRLAAWPMC